MIEKDSKPFLVESTVRRFEANDISIPKADEELQRQLTGYYIAKIGSTGMPIYAAGKHGDHALDALMLSVVAFVLEESAFGKPMHSAGVSIISQIGEPDAEVQRDEPVNELPAVTKTTPYRSVGGKPNLDRNKALAKKPFGAARGLPAASTTLSSTRNAGWEDFRQKNNFKRDEVPHSRSRMQRPKRRSW